MKKIIKNVFLGICAAVAVFLTVLFLGNDSPIPVDIPQLDVQEIAAKKEEAQQVAKAAQRKARVRRVYACKQNEDCVIVDQDPCGCAVGPQGVVAINVDRISEFYALSKNTLAKACPDTLSTEKECSPSARAVCKASVCKIEY